MQTYEVFLLLFKSTFSVENELATPITHLPFIFSHGSVQSEERSAILLVFPSPASSVALRALLRGGAGLKYNKKKERE